VYASFAVAVSDYSLWLPLVFEAGELADYKFF
jgi:hypothetical protein